VGNCSVHIGLISGSFGVFPNVASGSKIPPGRLFGSVHPSTMHVPALRDPNPEPERDLPLRLPPTVTPCWWRGSQPAGRAACRLDLPPWTGGRREPVDPLRALPPQSGASE
jgi:hypothetical protein